MEPCEMQRPLVSVTASRPKRQVQRFKSAQQQPALARLCSTKACDLQKWSIPADGHARMLSTAKISDGWKPTVIGIGWSAEIDFETTFVVSCEVAFTVGLRRDILRQRGLYGKSVCWKGKGDTDVRLSVAKLVPTLAK